ncbi:uncharacterized protein LOC127718821 [Mytilus californianus]|uniref:uncharacterized protein LOC127718821 n=1 Tax=Mytilus californianus TaxID=6549 RepID=UPI0022461E8F|nr:uncharacterized protein LOC127718821 [Mytilus californianus]
MIFMQNQKSVSLNTVTFEGRTLTFRNDVANLDHFGFLRMISSVRILRGAWVGYDGRDYAGSQTLFLKGDYTPTQNPNIDGGFPNDGISALRKIQLFPVGPLKLKTIEYDLENAILHTTPRSVFQWTEVNDTKVEQTVNRTDEQKITRENTYEFRWDFGFKITTSLEATAGIPELGSSLKLQVSVERSLNIGETTGVKTSFIQQWKAEYPSKIPAKSTVTLTSKLTEGKFNVPFTATFYRGEDETHTEVHQGTFMGVQFTDFHTEFKQTPLNLKR